MEEETQETKRLYCGVIWCKGDEPGERFEVFAANPDAAKRIMEERFGAGHVFTLYSPEDEEKLR
jgi:hypothetical protein